MFHKQNDYRLLFQRQMQLLHLHTFQRFWGSWRMRIVFRRAPEVFCWFWMKYWKGFRGEISRFLTRKLDRSKEMHAWLDKVEKGRYRLRTDFTLHRFIQPSKVGFHIKAVHQSEEVFLMDPSIKADRGRQSWKSVLFPKNFSNINSK